MNTLILGEMKYARGAATLIFSIILLLLATYVTFSTSKSVLTETSITNNDYRSKAAFDAAEAGIARAYEALQQGKRVDDDFGVFGVDPVKTNSLSYSISEGGRIVGWVDVTVTSGQIVSTGQSDDKTASKTITVTTAANLAIGNVPENPWISRGNTSITGSATVYNQEGASTIWTGGSVALSGTETRVANPQDPSYPECMETSFSCQVSIASNSGQGFDVIPNDATLASLSSDDFFRNFFGYSPSYYKNQIANEVYTPAELDSYISDLKSGVYEDNDLNRTTIWVDGDVDLQANSIIGCDDPSGLHANGQLVVNTSAETICESSGAELKPVILIVDGDLDIKGGVKFYGILFVTGDVTGAGTNDVVGTMIVGGSVEFSGGDMSVWYNSDVISGTDNNPMPKPLSGGWRDF